MANLIIYQRLRYFAFYTVYLLLANITILLCFFFLFLLLLIIFFASSIYSENARLRLALVIAIGTPITVAKDAIETPPLVTDKKNQRFIKIIKKRNVFTKFFTH